MYKLMQSFSDVGMAKSKELLKNAVYGKKASSLNRL
jgi:hypothetical protein